MGMGLQLELVIRRILYIAIWISVYSCNTAPNLDLTILESLILRDFDGIPTRQKLLPITLSEDNYLVNEMAKLDKPPNLLDPKSPPTYTQPPYPINTNSLEIHRILFTSLIRNHQITINEYESIKRRIKEAEGNVQELLNPEIEFINNSAAELIYESEYDSYQEFSYPIMSENLLIVYRNSFSGLQHADTLGLIGNGTYYVYEKSEDNWILINRITAWIS